MGAYAPFSRSADLDHAHRNAAGTGKLQLLCCPFGRALCYPALRFVSGTDRPSSPILAKLKRRGALTINTLADYVMMDRTTLGRAVQPLERNGLIRVGPAPSGRRARRLHLTKAGEKRRQAGLEAWARLRRHASKQALAPGAPPSCGRCRGQSSRTNSCRQLKSRARKGALCA